MYGYDNSYAKVALWKDCGDSVALGCLMLLIYFAAANRAIEIKDKMSNQHLSTTEQVKSGDGEASGQR